MARHTVFDKIAAAAGRPSAKLLLLPLLAAAVYARDPKVFESPRFWAEEGSSYFQSAVSHGWLRGLTNVAAAEHAPYLNLIPQLGTWAAAHFVPLELAPAVTTGAWALVVLIVVLVVLYGKAKLLEGTHRRLLLLAAPFLAVSNSETWANTLGAHFWADFALLLLVLEGAEVTGRRRLFGLVVFTVLSVLSPTSWLLLPAVIALCAHRWAEHRAYLYALGSAVIMHVLVSLAVFPAQVRQPASIPEAAHLVVSKLLVWPLAGFDAANRYVELVRPLSEDTFRLWGYLLAVAFVGLVIAFGRASRRDPTTSALLWTHLAATAGFVFFGLHVGRGLMPLLFGARYAWLPNALLIPLLGHQLDFERLRARKPSQLVFAVAFIASLAVGVIEYRNPETMLWMRGPDWRAEVERYEYLPNYTTLQIWPNGWSVRLR